MKAGRMKAKWHVFKEILCNALKKHLGTVGIDIKTSLTKTITMQNFWN